MKMSRIDKLSNVKALPCWTSGRHSRSSVHLPRRGRAKFTTSMVFTGIVQGKAQVKKILQKDNFRSITLDFPEGATDKVVTGASVAINGTCLTVVEQKGSALTFDVIGETLSKTNLGELQDGHFVNFERAARFGDEIGGHCVSGHVHTQGIIKEIEITSNNVRYAIEVPESWTKYILPKGYIAVDGASLTVGEVSQNAFNIYLIPETLRVTIIQSKKEGDTVNIEIDSQTQTIVDTIERYMAQRSLSNLQMVK